MTLAPEFRIAAACALALTAASLALVSLLRRSARLPQDAPNARSLHSRALPRGGGLAIWAGALPVALLWPAELPGGLVAGLAVLAVGAVSFLDDRRGLPAAVRLTVHLAASGVAAAACFGVAPSAVDGEWLAWPIAALAIAWSANLFNFMDGSDGLAATMALAGFAAYGAASAMQGDPQALPWAIAAATVPFLAVNRPPARMFMGDVGAVPLGFVAALLGLGGIVTGRWPAWFPLLAFLPFVADATVTLTRRALRGARVWEAHREHYYQRHHLLGRGHAGTLRLHAALMAACAFASLAALRLAPGQGWLVLAAACAVLAAVYARIDYHWRRRMADSA